MNISDFNGIVLYDIELDGCLNGVYTNMGTAANAGVINNEIARKKNPSKNTNETAGIESGIDGEYDCQYFDKGNTPNLCTLTINKDVGNNAYSFEWKQGTKIIFTGRGYKMNSRQIAVHYWQ